MANWVFNWSRELEPSLTWTVFPIPSEFEVPRFYCRYHPSLYNLPWSAWPDTRQQIPIPPQKQDVLLGWWKEKGESTGLRGSTVPLSVCQTFLIIVLMKNYKHGLPFRKRWFFQGRAGGFWGEEYPLKIIGKIIGGNLIPRVPSYLSLHPSLSLSCSIGTSRREPWEWGWIGESLFSSFGVFGGLCFQDTQLSFVQPNPCSLLSFVLMLLILSSWVFIVTSTIQSLQSKV